MDTHSSLREFRLLERLVVSPEGAKAILELRISPEDQRRMDDLRQRNNQGPITPEERAEMEAYVDLGAMLTILHSKARQTLNGLPVSAGAA